MLRLLWQRKKLQKSMINFWRIVWIITLLIGEWYLFIMAMKRCQWKSSYDSSISEMQRIAIIADPQVTDFYSYKGRNSYLMWFTEKYSDLYMKRSYKHLTNKLQPDASLFLGDLMDGGREWDDEGFNKQVKRFFNIFPKNRVNKNIYTTGNHDIGIRDGIKNEVYLRFRSIFGSTSSIHTLAYNHTLVVLDTVLLTGDQKNKRLKKEAWDIMNQISQQQQQLKRINNPLSSSLVLFSHVPFYRPEGTFCGPFRVQSRPSIYQGYGYQYQNLLEERLSNFLLYHLQPKLIFSGDDHDFCNTTHEYYDFEKEKKYATEYTIPSFSMAQGVRSPGFMLLQPINNNNDDDGKQQQRQYEKDPFLSQLCWLPDQLGIFISYGIMATLTFISIFIKHMIWYYYRYKRFSMLENKKLDQKEIDEYFIGMDLDREDNDHKQQEQEQQQSKKTVISILNTILLPSLYDLKDIIIIALPFYILCLFIL